MYLVLTRIYKCDQYTIGRLYLEKNGQMTYLCDTLEDRDRGLKLKWPLSQILAVKVPGETALPLGSYKIIKTISPKFKYRVWGKKYGGYVPEITPVSGYSGFSGTRLHPANKASEIEGCVAVGKNTIKGQVTQSQKTYYDLMDKYIVPAWDKGEAIYLTIK